VVVLAWRLDSSRAVAGPRKTEEASANEASRDFALWARDDLAF